jgi:alpha-glucuronidase
MKLSIALVALLLGALPIHAEDGYSLWLRHAELDAARAVSAAKHLGPVEVRAAASPTIALAKAELERALPSLLGARFKQASGGIVLARSDQLAGKPPGSFRLTLLSDGRVLVLANDDIGLLYGAFALLRDAETLPSLDHLDQMFAPAMPLRMLNHWDNPTADGHIERGYAGVSIFDWWRLPGHLDQRIYDYARANASIGINGTVVNNVAAKAYMLTAPYVAKLKRLADAMRPYGIRVYLSARYSAPVDLGDLDTADPLDPRVRAWWKAKTDAIYAEIPDFGGFLVKANSEGQPGPQDDQRSFADGANMLAAAVGGRGIVLWRAFVYQSSAETDRTKLAYEEFKPLDGKFAANALVQIKNGPLDFQPREPIHPLFGSMPKTRTMLEVQITKEYLGQGTHQVYLAPMWKEVMDTDTGHGDALTVVHSVEANGMAGVSNIGTDRNWTGTHFDQANWYAFGRLAWNPALTSEEIAREWAAQTFSREPKFLDSVVPMMLASRQYEVDFMTPLGLAHLMASHHHYGPGPWVDDLKRPEWNPVYYHRADQAGIGFDRTATGSNALAQYAPSYARHLAEDEDYLLWVHHLPWSWRVKSGRTLWDEMVARYDRGVAGVDSMAATWQTLKPWVDAERFRDTSEFFAIQQSEARWWRDASLAYWQSLNKLPLPAGVRPPEHDLAWYKGLEFIEAPGRGD